MTESDDEFETLAELCGVPKLPSDFRDFCNGLKDKEVELVVEEVLHFIKTKAASVHMEPVDLIKRIIEIKLKD